MTTGDLWQAVALTRDLGAKPRRIWWNDRPIVLFRGAQGVAALIDRCPHRHAPLSSGRVVAGSVECPYHGWRFDGAGHCTHLPGLLGQVPRYRVPGFRALEQSGILYLSEGEPPAPPPPLPGAAQDMRLRLVHSAAQGRVIDVAENILDATHTHFTHRGLLRGLSAKRYRVQVEVTGGPGWVEAAYSGEDRQQGIVSTLLEGMRVRTIGRYRAPGIAELEYWGPKGLVLSTTFHLRQATPDRVEGIGILAGPHQGLWGWLKLQAFTPLFRAALAQDRRMLAQTADNAELVPSAVPLIGPLDFLRADIAAIDAGHLPAAAAAPLRHQIEL